MKKKILYSFIIGVEGMACLLLKYTKITIPCLFKFTIHVPCPGCGLTRAFREILNFHLAKAFSYNILSIPIFAILLLINFYLVIDLFYGKNKTKAFLVRFFSHPFLLFLCLFVSEIVNFKRGI